MTGTGKAAPMRKEVAVFVRIVALSEEHTTHMTPRLLDALDTPDDDEAYPGEREELSGWLLAKAEERWGVFGEDDDIADQCWQASTSDDLVGARSVARTALDVQAYWLRAAMTERQGAG